MTSNSTNLNNNSFIGSSSSTINPPSQELPNIYDQRLYNIVPLAAISIDQIKEISNVPQPILKSIHQLAHELAVVHSRITNAKKVILDLREHQANQTYPEVMLKYYKNVLTEDSEQVIKASLLDSKIVLSIESKSIKLIEDIRVFNSRASQTLAKTKFARDTFQIHSDNVPDVQWTIIVDYFIALKLCEFQDKQSKDEAVKAKKKLHLEKKRETNSIPAVLTMKDLKKLTDEIAQLKLKVATRPKPRQATPAANSLARGKKPGKPSTNPKPKGKKVSSNGKKNFNKGKQSKSQAAPSPQ